MMLQPEKKTSLGELLSAFCDGQPESEIVEQLCDRLRDNPDARAEYLDYMMVHGILRRDYSIGSIGAAIAGDAQAPDSSKSKRTASPILGFLGELIPESLTNVMPPRFSAWLLLFLIIGASVALSSGVTMLLFQNERQTATGLLRHGVTSNGQRTGEYVATLVGAVDARWDGAEVSLPDGSRLPVGEVRLAEGVAEIAFDGGAKVIIDGSARFVPQSSRGGLLRFGRIVVQTPLRASSLFSIQTSTGLFVGDGAEFAVEVDTSGRSKLHVIAGSVDVTGYGRSSTDVARAHVRAGEALMIEATDSGKLVPLAPQGDQFVRVLPSKLRHFPAGLVAYWNFDERGGPVFDLQHQNHGLLQGAVRTRGLVGKGAVTPDTDLPGGGVIMSHGDGGLVFTTGITVEALFVSHWNAADDSHEEIYRKDDGLHRVLLSFQNDQQGNHVVPQPVPMRPVLSFGLNVGGTYSELDMPLDGLEGRPTVAELTDGHVHHVAATYDAASGDRLLYIDGTLRFSEHFAPGSEILSGGEQPACVGNSFFGNEPFDGVIDEVALYSRALTAAEVADHWAKARRGKDYFEAESKPANPDSI